MLSATKIRIYPAKEQKALLEKQFGHTRYIYNWALNLRSKAYKRHGWKISYYSLAKHIKLIKKREHTKWLSEAHSQVLQQVLKINLETAYKNFFQHRSRYPKFKSKRQDQSIHFPQGVKFSKNNHIFIPILKQTKARLHREISGKIKTVTVSKTATGKYFASILTDNGIPLPKPIKKIKGDFVCGIDLGLKDFVVDSFSSIYEHPKFLNKARNNLRRKQKQLSRKKKGSNNRNKARILVAKAHEVVSNMRQDFQHKLSKHLVDENQVIGYEGLKVKNMMKNHHLARAIGDSGWRSFLTKIQYKAERQGKLCVEVDSFYPSSKLCHVCGYKNMELKLSDRSWVCVECKTVLDRDVNAAINIKTFAINKLKAEGLSVSACGGLCKTPISGAVACEARSSVL